jgi:tape measure domain-containing protein
MNNNTLEFFVKMKDMMSGGLAKLSAQSQKTFSQVQDGIDKTINKNKELANSFDNVSAKATSSGGSVGKWAKGLALGVAAAATVALTAGAVFGKDAVSKAMEFGATKESFKVLAGDSKKGEGLANSLNKLQQDTILGPEVFKSAQTMLGFGIASEKVLPTMRMLGDISMGNAGKLESLTLAFSQIQSAGKLQGQDLLQLINAGFNPLGVISKKTGVSMGELKKMMEKGAISAGMVEEAFKSATSEGGLFNGMMNKLADTPAGKMAQLSGQWEAFQVKAGEALMPIAVALMDMAAPLIDMANTYLPVIQQWIASIKDSFTGTSIASSGWGDYLKTAYDTLSFIWVQTQGIFQGIWHILSGVVEWVKNSAILQDAFWAISKVIEASWWALKKVIDALVWIWDKVVKPILDAIDTVYSTVKDFFGGGKKEVAVSVHQKITSNVPTANSSSSVTASQAAGTNTLTDMMKGAKGADKDHVAKGVTSGGPRVINITIGKMVEKIEMHVGDVKEGLNNMERQVEEVLLRVLNSGAAIQ